MTELLEKTRPVGPWTLLGSPQSHSVELRKLTDEGILVDGNVMGIRTEYFICDAPARSFGS